MTYKWDQLSKYQQAAARRIAFGALADVGPATTSQVARYLDDCMDFERGTITLDDLYAATGWLRS
jgi:hypothetical protein